MDTRQLNVMWYPDWNPRTQKRHLVKIKETQIEYGYRL